MELNELKTAVLKAAGIAKIKPLHCALLAGLIYERTDKRVSITTLKRIYGFAYRKFHISAYSISVLTEFTAQMELKRAS